MGSGVGVGSGVLVGDGVGVGVSVGVGTCVEVGSCGVAVEVTATPSATPASAVARISSVGARI